MAKEPEMSKAGQSSSADRRASSSVDRSELSGGAPQTILGISCDYHDAAAALVVGGTVVAAIEEERLSRLKHDNSLPTQAVAACLDIAGLAATDIDAVIFHEKPLMVISRVLAARQRRGPMAIGKFVNEFPVLLKRNLFIAYRIEKMLAQLGAKKSPRLLYSEHHLSHAAAAFYPSPFPSAAVLTIDGIGEWSTATIGHGTHHRLELLEDQRFPNSYGLLYSLLTEWCGFQPNEGEYKLMGLAPFGEPTYRDAIDQLATLHDDGSLEIDGKALKWWGAKSKSLKKVAALFDGPPLEQGGTLTQREANLARSVQEFTEDAVLRMAAHAHALTGESDLVMAGGVALNCVANGRLLREGPFDRIWVQPAAGDAGSALGAALWLWHAENNQPRKAPQAEQFSCYLGPAFDESQITAVLDDASVPYETMGDDELFDTVAGALAAGQIVAWFQGRMEFGPRALGNRSFLADPRLPNMQRDLNMRTKGREGFRPFAPVVLADRAADWFEMDAPSPYMLFTFPVAESKRVKIDEDASSGAFVDRVNQVRSEIPACTHVDFSARVQTIDENINPRFARLLATFDDRTGCPVLLNTSFNRAGEPIVCTPQDALASARTAQADLLVMGNTVVRLADLGDASAESNAD